LVKETPSFDGELELAGKDDPRQIDEKRSYNLSDKAVRYLKEVGSVQDDAPNLFYHSLAVLHSPAYRFENDGGLRQDWPRVPLPGSSSQLVTSAELGQNLANLLNPETPVMGVTTGLIRPELRALGAVQRVGGGQLNPEAEDLYLTAGWGHAGAKGATMPGRGRVVEREYSDEERTAIENGGEALGLSADEALALLGDTTYDVSLNELAFWSNIPSRVWEYTLGGYQVIKKWLSYRERTLLGRGLKVEEVREVMNMARRIAAILLMERDLNENYLRVSGRLETTQPVCPQARPKE
jgi:hypothetical protein